MNFFPWTYLYSSELHPGTLYTEYTVHIHWAVWCCC